MKKYILPLWLGILCFAQAKAQINETLTLEDAIALAMENNHAIQIKKQQVTVASNNAHPSNAGLLPTISLLGNAEYQNNNTDVVIRTFMENPPTVNLSDGSVATQTYSAAVRADYLLLGGFQGKYQFKMLQQQQRIAYQQQQVQMNQTALAVSELFLEIAKLQSQEDLLEKNVKIGEDRLVRIGDQFNFGKVTKLTVLQAQTDLNQFRTSLDQVLIAKNNLKRDLNFLIGIEAETKYRVSVTYKLAETLSSDDLKNEISANNYEIQLSKQGVELADNAVQLNKSTQLPTINAFASYGYFRQVNDIQQLAEIDALGFTVGVGMRFNIFSGGTTKRRIQNAMIESDISKTQQDETKARIFATAIKELNNLEMLQNQLTRENENIETFRQSYSRTEERFFTGKATSLDLKNAQLALLNAEVTINNLKADIMHTAFRIESLKGSIFQ